MLVLKAIRHKKCLCVNEGCSIKCFDCSSRKAPCKKFLGFCRAAEGQRFFNVIRLYLQGSCGYKCNLSGFILHLLRKKKGNSTGHAINGICYYKVKRNKLPIMLIISIYYDMKTLIEV